MDAKEFEKLKAENAALKAELSKAKGRVVVGTDRAAQLEKNAKLRASLKEATAKKNGMAMYFIPESAPPFYREGRLYPSGSVVSLPLDMDPSVLWEPVEAVEAPKAMKPVAPPAGGEGKDAGKRAADRDI